MKFYKNVESYLKGNTFSKGLFINIAEPENDILSRFEFLKEIVKGKKIIHLGCCDHLPMNEYKIANKTWLHAELDKTAYRCLGVDIDKIGLKIMKDKYGYGDLLHADISLVSEKTILIEKWDFLIMGEIIEHLNNPIEFLKNIKKNYKNVIDKIVITAPNAFRYMNYQYAKKNQEIINSDHRFWFTPYTLAKIATEADLKIENFYFAQELTKKLNLKELLRPLRFAKKYLTQRRLKKYPAFRDVIIMVLNFNMDA